MNDETAREKLAEALHYASQDPEDYYQVAWEDNYARGDLYDAAHALLPAVREIVAEELREAADLIDRGPTFPLPPSIFSALVRERADALHPAEAAS